LFFIFHTFLSISSFTSPSIDMITILTSIFLPFVAIAFSTTIEIFLQHGTVVFLLLHYLYCFLFFLQIIRNSKCYLILKCNFIFHAILV
jgi:uncharacterized membrane protein YqaE (UPF0057 family)